jgi:hypothetical protein
VKQININSSIKELNEYLVYHYIRYNIDKINTSKKRLEFVVSLLNKRKHEGESLLFENGYGWLNHNIFTEDIDVDLDKLLVCMINNNINVDILYVENESVRFKDLESICTCTRNNTEEANTESIKEETKEVKQNLNKESKMKKALKYTAIVVLSVAVGVAGKFAFDKYKN